MTSRKRSLQQAAIAREEEVYRREHAESYIPIGEVFANVLQGKKEIRPKVTPEVERDEQHASESESGICSKCVTTWILETTERGREVHRCD
ncbi:hypothetical protein ACPOL_3387 [Acidisarcina polymorpha]|uniref:Uncharacterized protein n=1 Tax=Acidisarcina polymorpha TaxID=2211140 RepID=A0A2Z5G2C1_9BACT|nr:hypothetical protein [Acidisarcina polymorpha]AXC12676.1 hypothetical protein ACPOL_3387 [Acidisarcina polymorpha]